MTEHKKTLGDSLANLAGSDQFIREQTGDFKKGVTSIYALFAIWMTFIAMFSGFGAYFFAQTFSESKTVSMLVGTIWGCMIFIIERTMIAVPDNKKDAAWGGPIILVFRATLTLAASMLATHSMLINYFYDEQITSLLNNNAQIQRTKKVESYQQKINTTSTLYSQKINILKEEKICLNRLMLAEKGKDNTTIQTMTTNSGVVCGSTSGEGASCGTNCKKIEKDLDIKEQELESAKADLEEAVAPYKAEIASLKESKDTPDDIIARTEALEQLKEQHPSVARMHFWLALLLILAEMCIVVFKTFMPKLPSDIVYESRLKYFDETNRSNDDLKLRFEKQMQKVKYDAETEYNKAVIDTHQLKSSLEIILEKLQETEDMIDEHREIKLRKLSFLNFKERRKVHAEIAELEVLLEHARKIAIQSYMANKAHNPNNLNSSI